MPVFVAFLRGINVGGNAMIPMAGLKALFDKLGFKNTRTLLQSGNVVFAAPRATPAALAKKIAAAVAKAYKKDIFIAVRTPDELKSVLAHNPFPDAARDDPSHLLLMLLEAKPADAAAKAFAAAMTKFTAERARLVGGDLFIHYPAGIGTSKLTNTLIEKTLGVQGTARNWNTVTKAIALAAVVAEET
jgi:uncharacterized protein (DUF1697 family)